MGSVGSLPVCLTHVSIRIKRLSIEKYIIYNIRNLTGNKNVQVDSNF